MALTVPTEKEDLGRVEGRVVGQAFSLRTGFSRFSRERFLRG